MCLCVILLTAIAFIAFIVLYAFIAFIALYAFIALLLYAPLSFYCFIAIFM